MGHTESVLNTPSGPLNPPPPAPSPYVCVAGCQALSPGTLTHQTRGMKLHMCCRTRAVICCHRSVATRLHTPCKPAHRTAPAPSALLPSTSQHQRPAGPARQHDATGVAGLRTVQFLRHMCLRAPHPLCFFGGSGGGGGPHRLATHKKPSKPDCRDPKADSHPLCAAHQSLFNSRCKLLMTSIRGVMCKSVQYTHCGSTVQPENGVRRQTVTALGQSGNMHTPGTLRRGRPSLLLTCR